MHTAVAAYFAAALPAAPDAAAADEALTGALKAALNAALDNLNRMRLAEGEKLKADMLARMDTIEDLVKEIASRAPLVAEEWQDAHQRAHAQEINRRFDGRQVTTGQIVLFGLTGGLIPCPASITVLLICLQLKKFSLGATLVLGFSVGLALTLVASGAIAALSLKQATRRWPWLNDVSRKAPWFSGLLIIVVGIYMMVHGLSGL